MKDEKEVAIVNSFLFFKWRNKVELGKSQTRVCCKRARTCWVSLFGSHSDSFPSSAASGSFRKQCFNFWNSLPPLPPLSRKGVSEEGGGTEE